MEPFKNILIDQYNFSETDWDTTISFFISEVLPPKTFLVKQNKIADKLALVAKGVMRSFYIDDKGKDITLNFFSSGNVVLAADSFNNQTPANESIVTYETCEIISITHSNLLELYSKIPSWLNVCRDVADIKNKELIERTKQFQTLTAKERYAVFCLQYPEIIKKVPLSHIASYLGIDIATLSRIRKMI